MTLNIQGIPLPPAKNLANLIHHAEREKATALSLWERFIDFFRGHDKKKVVNKFYELLTTEPAVNANQAFGKYHRFKQLQRLADSEYQHLFKVSHTLHPDYSLVFKIDDVEIYRDTQCEVWQSLSELTSNSRPLIENYADIVKNTARDNREAFTLAYPESEIISCYGADQLMDYSCFYLQNNAYLKQTLQDYGLGCEKTASFIIEEMCEKMRFDDRRGTMEYALITIASTLKFLSENEKS